MYRPSYEKLSSAVRYLGYKWFDDGDYNLNLIGIRAPNREAGTFDDLFAVGFRQGGVPIVLCFPCTTDPGKRYLQSPLVPSGTAILAPGQYRGMWQIGMHRSKYAALVQRGPCTVYRDNNRDGILDDGPVAETGYFGINLHRASPSQRAIDVADWSAGCQVIPDPADFDLIMAIASQGARHHGNNFTYTLINEGAL